MKEQNRRLRVCPNHLTTYIGLEVTWDSYNARYGTNKGFKARIQKLEKAKKKA